MTMTLGGPMFERSEDEDFKSVHGKSGGHYNNYGIKPGRELAVLKQWFPDGEANDMNFVLFSTSGIHGTYITIEQVETGLRKYGNNPSFKDEDEPDDWHGDQITVLIVQPRICTVRHGNVTVTLDDIPFLKNLRSSSHRVVQKIGMPD